MTGFAVRAFRGMVPRTANRLLNDNQAIAAMNCKITSGKIVPLDGLGLVHTSLAASIATIYRYRYQGIFNWLVSPLVVDYARSPTAQDTLGRFYYTGDGEPRMSTYVDAISGAGPYPAAWYVLGVPSPLTAPAIAAVGGVGVNEDRAYVYTYQNRYGEESGPSPQTVFTGKVDSSWNLSALDTAPPNNGTITAAVKDTPIPGQVTVTLDTVKFLAGYEELTLAGVTGMTDLNGKFAIVSIDTTLGKVVLALTTTQTYAAAGTWARVAPHNLTNMVKNIYRTIGTNTDYRFVASIPAATTTYSDTIAATVVAKASGITTLANFPPPKNLTCVVLLANGCLAGIAGNEFCMSEQGKPYSWPIAYRQSFAGTGVGLVASGNSTIILTDSYPLVATATVPETLSINKIPGDTLAPCVSKRSIVDIGNGALFASHDGLYVATTSGCKNITELLCTFDEWQLYQPSTFKSAFAAGRYYAMHDGVTGTQPSILMLHTKEADSLLAFTEQVSTMYSNPWDGKLYVGKGQGVYQWDADPGNRYLASWQMKEYQSGQSFNASVAQVQASFGELVIPNAGVIAANLALRATGDTTGEIGSAEIGGYEIGGSGVLEVLAATGSVQFTLIKNGVAVFTQNITSADPFRLPGEDMADLHSVQISSTVPVESIAVAQGMDELRKAGL